MNFTSYCIYLASFFIFKEILRTSSTSNYYDGLIKYLTKESKVHQVMFIHDQMNSTDQTFSTLEKTVNKIIPTLTISYSKFTSNLTENYLQLLGQPRRTTLFALQQIDNKTKSVLKTMNLLLGHLRILSKSSPLPKCLIVLPHFVNSGRTLNGSLQSFWKNDYLDVTYLTSNGHSEKLFKKIPDKQLFLNQLNPFTKKYTSRVVSSKSKWFPNKLHDLKGYNLKFLYGIMNNDIRERYYNKTKKLTEILSQVMNFNPQINMYMIKENATSFLKTMQQKKAEMWLNIMQTFNLSSQEIETSRIISLNGIRALVPQNVKFRKVIVVSQEFMYMILATICTICLVRFTALILDFKRNSWETLKISQIIMGMGTTLEPRNLSERIVFGSLLTGCIVYTGFFFSAILEINLRQEPEISSLAELATSSLTPMMELSMKNILLKDSLSHIRQIAERSIVLPDGKSSIYCFSYLMEYENVSCLIYDDAIEYLNNLSVKKGKSNFKILPEVAVYYAAVFKMRIFSPYAEEFIKIIQRALDTGLLTNFYMNSALLHNVPLAGEIEKEKLLFILLYVAVIGYSLSLFVFFIEMCLKYIKRRYFFH